jgi:hypothetical protein
MLNLENIDVIDYSGLSWGVLPSDLNLKLKVN